MSGSLNILGTSGQFLAKTGANNLGQSQTNFSWSAFLNIPAAFGTTGGNAQILGWAAPYSTQPLAIQFDFTVASFVALYLQGVGGVLQYNWTPVYGQTIHIMAAHRSVGTSTIYIDGVIAGTANNLGVTGAAGLGIQIGWNSAKTGSALLANLSVVNGVTWTQADGLLLRNGAAPNSGSLSAPATSWWTLGGTAGNNPALNDAGLTDQIGSNNFTSITNAADAVYSSNSIPYIPPVIIPTGGVQQPRSGNMIWVGAGKNPTLGSNSPANFTAVNTDPTFLLNGSPIRVLRYWSDKAHQMPIVYYMPYTPGSPPTAITMLNTDVLTWSVPDNWAVAGGSSLPAQSGTASNFVGSYEAGLFGYANFGLPAQPTMNIGWNIIAIGDGVYGLKNVMHRSPLTWTGALTSTADGNPLTCAPGGTVSMFLADPGDANGVDSKAFSTPIGTYTYIGDENNHANPMTVSLTSASSPSSITGPTITPGTISGNTETGKMWVWQVAQSASSTTWNVAPQLNLKAPTGQTTVSLSNHRATLAGDATSLTPGLAASDSLVGMLTASPGVVAASSRSLFGPDGATSYVFSSDLPGENLLSYQQPAPLTNWWTGNPTYTGNRVIPVYAVRPYNLTLSPKVFSAQKYVNPVSGAGFQADSTYPAYPYSWSPAAAGYGYDWWFPPGASTFPGTTIGLQVMEFVCADSSGNPVNHNLQSGQLLLFSNPFGTFQVSNAAGTSTVYMAGGYNICYVTSPTTFLWVGGSTVPKLGQDTRMAQVVAGAGPNGETILTAGSTVTMAQNNIPPIELYGAQCVSVPGMGLYVTIDHCMNDACVTTFLTRLYNSTNRGTPIYLQFSNEILLGNAQSWWLNPLMIIEGNAYREQTVMQRTYEVHQIAEGIWGADSASIIRVYQPFTNDPAGLTRAMSYAQQRSIGIDMIMLAPYPTIDSSQTIVLAAAQMCADRTDSIAHTGGPGGGQYPILPVPGYKDINRAFWRYNTEWNGPTGLVADAYAALAAANYTVTSPKFGCYETSINTGIWGGVSLSNHLLRAILNHDWGYHPSHYDEVMEYLNFLQQPGPAGTPGFAVVNIVGLMNDRNGDGSGAFECSDGQNDGQFAGGWQNGRVWQNQPAGRGTSNKFASSTPGLNGDGHSHDQENQSVASQAINDWLNARAGSGPAPSYSVSPTQIHPSGSATLTLTGSGTSWTSGSVVSVTNSISGTTTVTAGVFTATSTTSATLAVTTGLGTGNFSVTVDGVVSPLLTVQATSFTVSPSRIRPSAAATLNLSGVGTFWSSGSTVSVQNSITGTTTVSAGTFTAISATVATLAVTAGAGVGTWTITVDGVVSGSLTVGTRQRGWFGGLARRIRG